MRDFGMKKILTSLAAFGLVLAGATVAGTAAFAQEEAHNAAAPTHFPIKPPQEMSWSFAGPFGTYDKAQLQRGLKVYKEVCSACHSMHLVAFRTLEDLGYTDAQVKAFAAEYTVQDGPNDDGDMFDRPGKPSDYFPSPFPNDQAAAAANGGAAPPDMSLLAKARGVERGFPQFVFDIFTQYAENGPDYIHSVLTGYDEQPPAGMVIPEGTHYNPHFASGVSLAMAKPLSDDQVTYDDGAPQTVEQYSQDVSAFLMWAAEPHLEDRKKTGFRVIIFLLLFAGLMYMTKRKVWADVAH
jgi:ubiquinol-cytochrome c reductase cytochrome c1 subunit